MPKFGERRTDVNRFVRWSVSHEQGGVNAAADAGSGRGIATENTENTDPHYPSKITFSPPRPLDSKLPRKKNGDGRGTLVRGIGGGSVVSVFSVAI